MTDKTCSNCKHWDYGTCKRWRTRTTLLGSKIVGRFSQDSFTLETPAHFSCGSWSKTNKRK